ncbi:MAG: prepilin-type N-terminal cleavage/methylation domain-containing protein [Lachnospiraceae bacterium]|jgi:prepilin-type N-terminal cleavage/methylation domain-containing protein|nr:prepilin-type N-terminal cleavage/methylation domain-containing protein [Lachnospiraceae bacterium]
MKKNKGYSLVEMLIVIAIMAILGGLTFISLGIMRDARRQAAANNFNNLISSCLIKTKAVTNPTPPPSSVKGDVAMVITQRSDGKYTVRIGYLSGGNVYKITDDVTAQVLDSEVGADCDAVFPKEVEGLQFIAQGADDSTAADVTNAVITFDKSDGRVTSGAGKYQFMTSKFGNLQPYATITLDETTGNHSVK